MAGAPSESKQEGIQKDESNTARSSGFRLRQEDKLKNDGAGRRRPPLAVRLASAGIQSGGASRWE